VSPLSPLTIVSGGQTGADRAALGFAIDHGLAHGGWCPRGRRAEDGPLDPRYQLRETPSEKYDQRTKWNVRDSDATAIFTLTPELHGGTALTREIAERLGKPWLHLVGDDLSSATIAASATRLVAFLAEHQVVRLNVAGPRASQAPLVANFVDQVLSAAWRSESTRNM
jgi:Circularly permutated YpsA SLOG family